MRINKTMLFYTMCFQFPESKKMKKQKAGQRMYTEGWIEILSKKTAKEIAQYMNNQPIGGSKKSKWFDYIWNIKYLPG